MTAATRDYAADEVLKDGGSIHIRAIRPDDRERLLDHFHRLSARSVYFRFFGAKRRLTDAELDGFTRLDFARNVGLVATLLEAGTRAHHRRRTLRGPRREPARRRGRVRRRRRAPGARHRHACCSTTSSASRARRGIAEFHADVLGENNQMLEVFARERLRRRSARRRRRRPRHVPDRGDRARRGPPRSPASCARPRRASAPLLAPRSVAVVGASRRPGTIGGRAASRTSRAPGFTGPIYPVNPEARRDRGPRAPTRRIERDRRAGRPRDRSPCPRAPSRRRSPTAPRAGVRARRRDLGRLRRGLAGRGAPRRSASPASCAPPGMRMVGPELHGRPQHRSGRRR